MKKVIEIIKKKWLRDTILTILLIAIIVVAYFGLNFWVSSLNIDPFDFTQEKLYTLSDESKEEVKGIGQEVHIYFFGYEETSTAYSLARQYSNVNSKISAEIININERPDLAKTYGIDSEDSVGIVVQAEERYKVLSSSDLYTYDSTTYETIDITEQKLTNSIIDTTISKKPKIYFLTGHEEYNIASEMSLLAVYMENEVNEVEELDLLTTEFPEDCDTLVIASPLKDFADMEAQKITNYINNGGNILWLNDAKIEETQMPNIQKILDLYGMSVSNGVIVETSSSRMLISNPYLIIPEVKYHEITKDVYNGTGLVLPSSGKLNVAESSKLEELGVTVSTLIESTQTSFYREDFTVSSSSKTGTDEEGTFTIAAEATKTLENDKTSKLIIFANAVFASDTSIQIQNQNVYAIALYNNKDIVLNSVAYLTDREDTIRIRKDVGYVQYTATAEQDNIIRAIIFGFPALIIVAGIIVWPVRIKNKKLS